MTKQNVSSYFTKARGEQFVLTASLMTQRMLSAKCSTSIYDFFFIFPLFFTIFRFNSAITDIFLYPVREIKHNSLALVKWR